MEEVNGSFYNSRKKIGYPMECAFQGQKMIELAMGSCSYLPQGKIRSRIELLGGEVRKESNES